MHDVYSDLSVLAKAAHLKDVDNDDDNNDISDENVEKSRKKSNNTFRKKGEIYFSIIHLRLIGNWIFLHY